MASALYSQDLTCPICYTIFTDSVNLLCGHSFCRECIITDVESSQHRCPECETAVPTEAEWLPTIHILKSLAEKAKEAEKVKKGKEKAEVAELCLEHEEKLKLSCVTDQQLACIICRDGERHEGHKFKPIKEAAASLRQELEKGMENLRGDILATESLANTQREEAEMLSLKGNSTDITVSDDGGSLVSTPESNQTSSGYSSGFSSTTGSGQNTAFGRSTFTGSGKAQSFGFGSTTGSGLSTAFGQSTLKPQSVGFGSTTGSGLSTAFGQSTLKPQSGCFGSTTGSSLSTAFGQSTLKPQSFGFGSTTGSSLSTAFGQSTLKPQSFGFGSTTGSGLNTAFGQSTLKPQSFGFGSTTGSGLNTAFGQSTLKPQSGCFGSTTGSGLSTAFGQSTLKPQSVSFGSTTGSSLSTAFGQSTLKPQSVGFGATTGSGLNTAFGQTWELGIKDNFLKYDGKKYATCSRNKTTELEFGDRPRKIGIYLNCASKKLSFYDADNMTHIHAMSSPLMSMPLSAYFNIRVRAPNPNPLTVCWY